MIVVKGKYSEAVIYNDKAEDYAVFQVRQLMDQEAFEGCIVRVMPDVHPGKVGPIGFTSTLGYRIMPAVIGIDIGCGMTMAKLMKGKTEFQKLDRVIRESIPSGFNKRARAHRYAEEFDFQRLQCLKHVNIDRSKRSLGTLGGGNHFIELDKDNDDNVFVIIHSGSRHLGKEVTEFYLSEGQEVLKAKGIDIPYELTYLEGSLRDDYLHDLSVVQQFAAENRRAILDEISKGMKWKLEDEMSCIHNYVDFRGENPIMRKGAISAEKDEPVIIPINMRDGVIIGKGLGNKEWNMSAPHGSGRIMSREEVKNSYTVSQFKKEMGSIYSTSVGKGTLDEAPFAYRGINEILDNISDTVEVTAILKPVYNYKAGSED